MPFWSMGYIKVSFFHNSQKAPILRYVFTHNVFLLYTYTSTLIYDADLTACRRWGYSLFIFVVASMVLLLLHAIMA